MLGHRKSVLASRWWLVALVALTACGSPEQPAESAQARPAAAPGARPDIVLVSIDSLRADHLGCYGYARPTSPGIDRLAAEGVRFHNTVSTTSWTLPAHAALLTGLYDSTHGLVDNGLTLSDNVVTLAEVMKDAGYRTAGFYGGPYLNPTYGFGQGFDTYVSCMAEVKDPVPKEDAKGPLKGQAVRSFGDVTGPRTLQQVTAWMDTLDERPFFLFLHLWDVHYDYIPPDEYIRMFDPDYAGSLTGHRMMRSRAVSPAMPKRDLEHLIALYDGEIRFTDDILGKILAEIDRRGRLDASLVVVTADHGEEFFEHGNKGHQKSLYDEVLRVPLIVRWPGRLDAGRVVDDQVRLIDVAPTIASLAGVPLSAEVQGRDLGPLMRGGTLAAEPALCELHTAKRQLFGVRTERSKFISFPTPHWWQFGYQYFDLESDPGERDVLPVWSRGLLAARSTLGRLREDADALRKRLGDTAVPGAEIDEEQRERLRSLGYIDGAD